MWRSIHVDGLGYQETAGGTCETRGELGWAFGPCLQPQ